nr:4464_t:CDS:2 [Entrophospora candida]CAG8477457.1 6398_t:CDS:2 [Entrophospora candida]
MNHQHKVLLLYKKILKESSQFFDEQANPEPKPFISSVPRTAPPRISPPLEALLNSQVKSLYPPLPQPKHKPLHPRRKANILWWHHSRIMKNVSPPVSQDVLNELELKAGKNKLTQYGLSKVNKDAILKSTEKDDQLKLPPSFEFIRERSPSKRFKDPPYHTAKPHRPRPRFIRRIYQRLLSNIPILTLKESAEPNSDDDQKENYGSSLKAKDFIVTKSVWANGRPKPLINDKDWQGLDLEEITKNLKGKKKN